MRPTLPQTDPAMHDEKVEVAPSPTFSALPSTINFNFNSIPKLEVGKTLSPQMFCCLQITTHLLAACQLIVCGSVLRKRWRRFWMGC